MNATPLPNSELIATIKQTDFKDPASLSNLTKALLDIVAPDPLPIGTYSIDDEVRTCFIDFQFDPLPIDFEYDVQRPDTGLTYIKCDPTSSKLPNLVLQLGPIQYNVSKEIDVDTAVDTSFVAVVNIIDRKAWAVWNPTADLDLGLAVEKDSASTRPANGAFPGFTKDLCTAIPFDGTIDDLIAGGATSRLGLFNSNFVTVPSGTIVTFGGVNTEGWTHLAKVSAKWAQAAKA